MLKILPSAALFVAAAMLPSIAASAAERLTVLTEFNGTDGQNPFGSLLADTAGNLYGTTIHGGQYGNGTVFKLTPPLPGQTVWTETVLVSLHEGLGAFPFGSLIADTAGNLYGTTASGGKYRGGTVFRLAPPGARQTMWTETVLTSFNGTNGAGPYGNVIADKAGNLYGTTRFGGATNDGTVFELTPPTMGQGAWTETVLASIGGYPEAGLIIDKTGSLFGTTSGGGASSHGTAFKLTPPKSGRTGWTVTNLTSFNGTTGQYPSGNLIADAEGNLYGTTGGGGSSDYGVVFELTRPAAGQTVWTETVLTSFNGTNGAGPVGSLIADKAGDFFGVASGSALGGAFKARVFKLTPPAAGQTAWTESTVATFKTKNGIFPRSSLIADKAGNLYGTAWKGGMTNSGCKLGCGTVFTLRR